MSEKENSSDNKTPKPSPLPPKESPNGKPIKEGNRGIGVRPPPTKKDGE